MFIELDEIVIVTEDYKQKMQIRKVSVDYERIVCFEPYVIVESHGFYGEETKQKCTMLTLCTGDAPRTIYVGMTYEEFKDMIDKIEDPTNNNTLDL